MEEKQERDNQKIEIIHGNSKDMNISPVKDNLPFEVSKDKTPKKHIIIPGSDKKD